MATIRHGKIMNNMASKSGAPAEWIAPAGWSWRVDVFSGDPSSVIERDGIQRRAANRAVKDADGKQWIQTAYFTRAGEMVGEIDWMFVLDSVSFSDEQP